MLVSQFVPRISSAFGSKIWRKILLPLVLVLIFLLLWPWHIGLLCDQGLDRVLCILEHESIANTTITSDILKTLNTFIIVMIFPVYFCRQGGVQERESGCRRGRIHSYTDARYGCSVAHPVYHLHASHGTKMACCWKEARGFDSKPIGEFLIAVLWNCKMVQLKFGNSHT